MVSLLSKTYGLSRSRKKKKIKELDIGKFEKIAPTGSGLVLKYKKGKTIILSLEYIFDEFYIKAQQDNDEAVRNRTFHYIKLREDENPSPKTG